MLSDSSNERESLFAAFLATKIDFLGVYEFHKMRRAS